MTKTIEYAVPGPLTSLSGVASDAITTSASDAAGVCSPVPSLVIQPLQAEPLHLPEHRLGERNIRPAAAIVDALLAIDPAPLTVPREPASRVVGTCRHFAVLACALLRHHGIAARVRCGFATYFQPGQGLDHWVIEYRGIDDDGWTRMDAEYLGLPLRVCAAELKPGEFLTGGEAWAAHREGRIDAAQFGVCGTGNWGPAEIRGNAIRDLAALNKVEMLPWDEWGRMTASYRGETGADYDELMDTIAAVTAADDTARIADLYLTEDLQVPAELVI